MKAITSILSIILFIPLSFSQEKEGIVHFQTENKIIYDICFSAKGEVIAVPDNSTIKIFRTDNKEMVMEFNGGHRKQIMSVDISLDSTLLASGSKDSTIVLWDFKSGIKLKTLVYHKGLVTSVKFSPDSRYLVTGSTDHKVCLYDVKNGSLVKEFTEHKDDVTCVTFSFDGKLFAAGGGDGIITLYSTEDKILLSSLSGHTSWVRDISFSHDGKRLISCGDDARIIKWDISDTKMIKNISGKKYGHQWILTLDNGADDNIYAFADITGSIMILWLRGTYEGKTGVPVNRILFNPASGYRIQIAVATRGKGVMLLEGKALKFYVKQKYNYFPFKS